MYLLVTEPLAWPTSAAIVTSVNPRSFAMLAKLWRSTCGVTSGERRFSESFSQWFGKLPKALSSPYPGKTSGTDAFAFFAFHELDHRQSNRPSGGNLFCCLTNRRQGSRPYRPRPTEEPIISRSAASSQRDLANDVDVIAYFSSGGVRLASLRAFDTLLRSSRRLRTLSFGFRMPWAGLCSMMPASTA